jgi:hypothetical protein
MTALDRLVPTPRLVEVDGIDLPAPGERVWERIRHGNLATSPLVRALFSLRTLPERLTGHRPEPPRILLDEIRSSQEQPGFQILIDDPPHEVVVGAIGQVWHLDIPFRHVSDAASFERFDEGGWAKVAWAIRVLPRGASDSRVEIEVRVATTDEDSWRRFRRYFRIIGPGSHFIRRSALAALERDFGTPEAAERSRPLPGDELLPDAAEQVTHGITIAAPPERIWPWLLQMGGRRAGFYSVDTVDNKGARSAREIHPELQEIAVGDVLPATPEGDDGFEVLKIEASHALILGGLFDAAAGAQRPFASARPDRFWQVTWAFVLEPLDAGHTRLHVRARAAFPGSGRLHAAWIRPVHRFMQTAQLRNLKERAEGRQARDDWRDVLAGFGGAAQMAFHLLTPFLRPRRAHWGLDAASAARVYPGDHLVSRPKWSWTHGIEIDASAEEVWGWIAQLGVGRGGFYSYQWLENLAGCGVRNAERIHPEWELREGDPLVVHPKMPPLEVVELVRGRHYVAYGPPDESARAAGKKWATVTWAFFVEPRASDRCRLISRYRCDFSADFASRLGMGATIVEPIGFGMDRRMLREVKERAESAKRKHVLGQRSRARSVSGELRAG